MRYYVCFDDTDTLDCGRGTGKLVRWFEDELPAGCSMWGVVRQQLLVHPDIPYTSHNSSACAVVEANGQDLRADLIELAIAHVKRHAVDGSDPGVCVVSEGDEALSRLVDFGRRAAIEVVSKADATAAADGVHLSEHGGTGDGIIGAAAGAGLTAWGWSGRFIEFGRLRDHPDVMTVAAVEGADIMPLPVERNVVSPCPQDSIDTIGWLRPRLWGGRACLPISKTGEGTWRALGKEKRHP